MRSFGKKITSSLLLLSILLTPILLPKHVEAQTGGKQLVGMAGCIGPAIAASGALIAIGTIISNVTSVPVADAPTQLSTQGTASASAANIFIQCVLNAMVKVVKEAMIAEITASMIRWINSGFEGGPDFITNPGDFFTTMADRTAGAFIEEIGAGAVCEPFRIDLQIALTLNYYSQRRDQPTCTLSSVMANIQNFYLGYGNIETWEQWFYVAARPENDPIATGQALQNRLSARIGNSRASWEFDLAGNGNFLGKKTCVDERPNPGDPNSTICYKYETLSPGQLAQNALDKVTGTGFYQLEIADAIDEIVGAFLAHLMGEVFTGAGGLLGLDDDNGGGSYLDQLIDESVGGAFTLLREQLLRMITATLDSLQEALNASNDPDDTAQLQLAITYLTCFPGTNGCPAGWGILPQVQSAVSTEELLDLQNKYLNPPPPVTYEIPANNGISDDVPPPPDDDTPGGP